MPARQLRPAPAGIGRVGMIGVGRMGGPMARRLLHAGHDLIVYDTSNAALEKLQPLHACIADSPREVGDTADTVFACLPGPAAVEQVALGAEGLAQGARFSAYVDLSTSGPVVMRKVADAFEKLGVASLDSPVSGGVAGAEAGTLAVMAAGAPALFDRLRPALEMLGNALVHVGRQPGQAQIMKLINNLLSVTAWTVTAEGMAIGAKAGLDPCLMLQVLNAGSGRNIATEDRYLRHVLSRKFDSGFTMAGIYKDISLCMRQAELSGVPTPIGQAVKELWRYALDQGWGDRSHAHIASLYEQWADIELKAP